MFCSSIPENPATGLRCALVQTFGPCGTLEAVRIVRNNKGKFRGFAYVQFAEKSGVEEALKLDRQVCRSHWCRKSICCCCCRVLFRSWIALSSMMLCIVTYLVTFQSFSQLTDLSFSSSSIQSMGAEPAARVNMQYGPHHKFLPKLEYTTPRQNETQWQAYT